MSLDFAVYARAEERIPVSEIREAMRARGAALSWTPRSPSGVERLPGELRPEGEGGESDWMDLSVSALDDLARDALVSSYGLSGPHRAAVEAATLEYSVALPMSFDPRLERYVGHLLDVLAEKTQGVILDMQQNRFFDRTEYRTRREAALRADER